MAVVTDIAIVVPTIDERMSGYATPLLRALTPYFEDRVELYLDKDRTLVKSHPASWALALQKGFRWCGVAEDDIILAEDFGVRLNLVLDDAWNKRYPVVNLYSNYLEDVLALSRGEAWRRFPGRQFRNEQFLIMRSDVVKGFLDFIPSVDTSSFGRGWSDYLLSLYFKDAGLDVMIVLPNLVDHKNEKSTVGHPRKVGGQERRSRTFGMIVP